MYSVEFECIQFNGLIKCADELHPDLHINDRNKKTLATHFHIKQRKALALQQRLASAPVAQTVHIQKPTDPPALVAAAGIERLGKRRGLKLKFVLISAAKQYLISAILEVKTILMVMWMLTALLLTRIKTTLAVTLKASLVVIWMVSALLLQQFKQPLAVPSLPVTLKPKVFVQMEHVTPST
jgi:hypothetical protein